jgi:hypothetical protein
MATIDDWLLIQPQEHIQQLKEKPKIKESTKEKMAEILIELHTKTSVRSFEQLVARKLNIQTLTTEQIKELSWYYEQHQDENILQLQNKLQEIIQQLNKSNFDPIEFDYAAERKEYTPIIMKLKKAIEKRENKIQELKKDESTCKLTYEKKSHPILMKYKEETTGRTVEQPQQDTEKFVIGDSHSVVNNNVQFTLGKVLSTLVVID